VNESELGSKEEEEEEEGEEKLNDEKEPITKRKRLTKSTTETFGIKRRPRKAWTADEVEYTFDSLLFSFFNSIQFNSILDSFFF